MIAMSSIASTFDGSAIATSSVCSSANDTGIAPWRLATGMLIRLAALMSTEKEVRSRCSRP